MTKYSIKNICLGIGLGLIIASVANLGASPRDMSVDALKTEAQKHNLIIIDAKELIQKQPDSSNTPAAEPKGGKPAEQTAPPDPAESKGAVQIVIESGATSEKVAQLLLEGKLTDNKQIFLDRLKELKKENKMQIGTFNIPKGSSIDEIINAITASPR
jgi:hypothetical protein